MCPIKLLYFGAYSNGCTSDRLHGMASLLKSINNVEQCFTVFKSIFMPHNVLSEILVLKQYQLRITDLEKYNGPNGTYKMSKIAPLCLKEVCWRSGKHLLC